MSRLAGYLLMGFLAAGIGTHSAAQGTEAATSPEALIYELALERAGSRSQGLHGRLYGEEGREIAEGLSLQPVETPLGPFQYAGCSRLWSDCGYLRVETRPPRHPRDPYASGPTVFRITRLSGGAEPVFRGALGGSDNSPGDADETADSPLGLFRRCVRFTGIAWSGWIPDSWLDKNGRAACAGVAPSPEPDLAGTKWRAPEVLPFTSSFGGAPGLSFEGDRAVLFLGCNSAEGKWNSPKNGVLRIELGGKTKMHCPDAIDDDVLFAAFDGPVLYEVEDLILTLLDNNGGYLVTMQQVRACPVEPVPGDAPC